MRYISPKEAAARWCISQRRVLILCEEGRIEGALRHSRVWLIPETAKKPADARIKSGRYIKKAQTSPPEKTKKEPEPADFCAIHMPGPTHATIFRPRLLEKIAPPGSALTYIHADAGYGKTTLLTQYAEGKNDVIWMSLDERDNNIIGFLNHLEDSFRIILPRYILSYIPSSAQPCSNVTMCQVVKVNAFGTGKVHPSVHFLDYLFNKLRKAGIKHYNADVMHQAI